MAFRDENEATRERMRALETELEEARRAAVDEKRAAEAHNLELEAELEETRQALKKAEWRSRGVRGAVELEVELEETRQALEKAERRSQRSWPPRPKASGDSDEERSDEFDYDLPKSTTPDWRGHLGLIAGLLMLLVFGALVLYGEFVR